MVRKTFPIYIGKVLCRGAQNFPRQKLCRGRTATSSHCWVSILGLTDGHIQIIEKEKWLEGDHITAAGKVLRKQFKDKINGLQDPGKAENPSLFIPQSSDPTIQIHHNGANHWLTITCTCKKGVVQQYDSKWHNDITPSVYLQLGALFALTP